MKTIRAFAFLIILALTAGSAAALFAAEDPAEQDKVQPVARPIASSGSRAPSWWRETSTRGTPTRSSRTSRPRARARGGVPRGPSS